MAMRPEATATRCVRGFAPTSTMRAEPPASKWVKPGRALGFICGRYHKHMRFPWLLTVACMALAPSALGQQQLPDLGSAGDVTLSPIMERRLGEQIMREIRFREPTFIDDPEVSEYLEGLGARLQAGSGARQDFEFFALREPTVNAFALPGGFIAVHTGLIALADTESELASVLGHEMGHVTQRHIARQLGLQQQMQLPVMAALAAAILLGRSRPDLAAGAVAGAQAGAIQTQLGYSRDFEREADRIGLQSLEAGGFDPRAMAVFFEKLQRSSRVSDDGTMPGYLRTHPVTFERIADAQNKAANMPYRQHLDAPEFQLVRAKLRAETGDARDAVTHFDLVVREGRFANESAARYGLASALLRAKRPRDADAEMTRLRASGASGPMIETLGARIKQARGDTAQAVALLTAARKQYSNSRSVLYAYVVELQQSGRNEEALASLAEPMRLYPSDASLRSLQAKCYAALGKLLLQHQAQAEVYVLQGSLPAAIEQLQLARGAGDGDFYQLSQVDARLKELRNQHSMEQRDAKR
jgi:predicted Zn-dependent protease